MAQPTVAEVSWIVDLPDSRSINVLHYDKTGTAWAPGDALELQTLIRPALLLDWPDCITDSCEIIRCVVQILNATFYDVSDSGGLAVPGTVSHPTFPAGTCGVMKKVTAEPGRSGRGRLYLAGLSETTHVNSYFDTTGAPFVALMAELERSYIAGPDTYSPVVWSRKTEDLHEITSIQSNPVLGHLRGRRPPAF